MTRPSRRQPRGEATSDEHTRGDGRRERWCAADPAKTLILGGEPEDTTETDPALAEDGVVRPHPGIEGDGNLPPAVYDWREPAALVQVERLGTGGGPS